MMIFLSTPSARRATRWNRGCGWWCRYFYPRPPRGGRRPQRSSLTIWQSISIHALREEGDSSRLLPDNCASNFYPRPPRGGRPMPCVLRRASCPISIHALREEGDTASPSARMTLRISIHALREEGDSKNGEKHLRFCFIIKRSAQIWKSLSKNIRKKSRDLHRTA